MKPAIEFPNDLELLPIECKVLQQMFADYARVVLRQEFTEGQSNTRVFLVVPYRPDQAQELPVVVKLGPKHLIQQEWAATHYTKRKLPGFVELAGEPDYLDRTESSDTAYGGLRYELVGQGLFQTESLRMYCRHATAADFWNVFDKRLFPQLNYIWQDNPQLQKMRKVYASYDRVLPVNLVIEPMPTVSGNPPVANLLLNAEKLQQENGPFPPASRGDIVQIEGFVVTEVEPLQWTVTLNLPQAEETRQASFRLRLQAVAKLDTYRLGKTAPTVTGRVVNTRQDLLNAEVQTIVGSAVTVSAPSLALPGKEQVQLPNPLHAWSALLQQELPMKIGTVHGDLNMGNVLIETQARTTQIIDCAHAHRDHALYDLLRLEMETLLHPLAAVLLRTGQPPTLIYELYLWADHVSHTEPHESGKFAVPQRLYNALPELTPCFIILTMIRNAARDLLVDRYNWREYYIGLVLSLLGSLKFASLARAPAGEQPKAVAFWGAATILQLLAGCKDNQTVEWRIVDLAAKEPTHDAEGLPVEMQRTGVKFDNQKIDERSGGIYFEGGSSVSIGGDIIVRDKVTKTTFQGPVSGPIHTGSGNIHSASSVQGQAESGLEALLIDLRRTITTEAPKAVRSKAIVRLERLDEAIEEVDLGMMESSLEWFQRQLPALATRVLAVIQHPLVAQRVDSAGELTAVAYRRRFGELRQR